MKILLVEDDPALADGLVASLTEIGFDVTPVMTASFADSSLRT